MSFEQLSYLVQIVASVGVIVCLIFVGLQIKHNTGALQRNEHNSTMAQWTVIRQAIAGNRDIAELMTAGLHGEDAMHLLQPQLIGGKMLTEYAWVLPHLGQNATRCLSEGDFRIDGWATSLRPAQDGAWRDLVAQRQTHGLHSWVPPGRRRRARREQWSARRDERRHP
jgi:hypothetical protein